MNDHILYKSKGLTEASDEIKRAIDALRDVSNDLSRVNTSDEWWTKLNVRMPNGTSTARGALGMVRASNTRTSEYMQDIVSGISKAKSLFDGAEGDVKTEGSNLYPGIDNDLTDGKSQIWEVIGSGLDKIKWTTGPAKKIIKGIDMFLDAIDKRAGYLKIGRAVGKQNATAMWIKNVLGLRKIRDVSKAGTTWRRFVANLTNPDFYPTKQLKETFSNLAGKNGGGKTFVEWAGIAVDGVLNLFGNVEEQKKSGGTMTNGRVVSETVMETIVDFGFETGAKFLLGAAVTAVAGTAGAPAILVAGGSVLLVNAVNAGVEKLTGQTATEWVSDFILDKGGEYIDHKITQAKKAGEVIAGWFSKLSFA